MSTEVKVPVLGESVAEATIGEWLKQPGDPVKMDEPIASLETDKVSVEVVFTPLTYAIVNWLKRREQEDYFDERTNFTPFSLKD